MSLAIVVQNRKMKEYIKIAYRGFIRNKFFSLINIVGLAIGLASALLILIWINEETSYEDFNTNKDNLYRLIVENNDEGKTSLSAIHPVPLAPYLKETFPNIVNTTRYSPGWGSLVEYNNEQYKNILVIEVDHSFFDMFTYQLIKGNKKSLFADIFSVVITEKLAQKVFGDNEPIGKLIKINQRDYTVSGIIENCPSNSHIQFEAITLFDARDEEIKKYIPDDSWEASAYYTYIMFDDISSIDKEELEITNNLRKVLPEKDQNDHYILQPIEKIHLYNNVDDYLEGHGNIKYIYIFSSIAFLILIIACINYMNLSTAKYDSRSKEVGIRKVCGADRKRLIVQFFTESLLNTVISIIIALILVELARPLLNSVTGKVFEINYGNLRFWGVLLVLILISSVASGSYPALFLSSFKVVNVFKKMSISVKGARINLRIRSILVVFQLIISMTLIIVVLFMFAQFNYIKSKDLGYNAECVICFGNSRSFANNYENIKADFLDHSSIQYFAQGNSPTNSNYGTKVKINNNEDNLIEMSVLAIDEDYINTYKIKLLRGRNFSKDITSDQFEAILINEKASKKLPFKNPIGERIAYKTPFKGFREGTIIGVIKDFHTDALYHQIQPLILNQESFWRYQLTVKYNDINQTESVIEHLEETWKKYRSDVPLDYYFFEDELKAYYENESRIFKVVTFFTIIAILISLLGILGLSYFTTETYSKQIGIKKILGAKMSNLIGWLMKDFTIKVAIAILIAFPLAYYFMNNWIANFSYHKSLSVSYFILGWMVTYILISIIMIIQVIKIAKMKPVESLRYE